VAAVPPLIGNTASLLSFAVFFAVSFAVSFAAPFAFSVAVSVTVSFVFSVTALLARGRSEPPDSLPSVGEGDGDGGGLDGRLKLPKLLRLVGGLGSDGDDDGDKFLA
jgi:hypothetical protein